MSRLKTISDSDIDKLTFGATNKLTRDLITFLIYTGCRKGEALNEIGIKISYKTYQKFIADNLNKKNNSINIESKPEADGNIKTELSGITGVIKLNNLGQVKIFSIKDKIKDLGFTGTKNLMRGMRKRQNKGLKK
ncbi:MAG: hypothetical protein ACYCTB_11155 [bacterium]